MSTLIKKFQNPVGTLDWTMPWYNVNSGWISNKTVSTEENPILYEESPELEQILENNELQTLINTINFRKNKWIEDLYLKMDRNIPYLKDKRVKLTHPDKNKFFKDRGVVISTNMLDSIAKYADKAGLPLKSALGLVGQESTFGNARYGKETDTPAEYLISNWSWEEQNPYTELINIAFKKAYKPKINSKNIEEWEIDKKLYHDILSKGLRYADNQAKLRIQNLKHPLQHGFELYKTGKYNPGDPNHTQMVEERGDVLMESPEIQKWINESPYVLTEKQGGRLIPKHAKGSPVNNNPLPKMPINTNPVPKKEDKKKKKLFEIDQRVIGVRPTPGLLTFPRGNGNGLYMIKRNE